MTTPHAAASAAVIDWLVDQVWAEVEDSPRLLWHYTDAGGLMGIVNGERLWATNTRFLNDSTELAYGLALARSCLRAYRPPAGLKPETMRFLSHLADSEQALSEVLRKRLDVYVVCFCVDRDLLSQWRAYAGGDTAGGYAVGIGKPHALQGWVDRAGRASGSGRDFRLRRVLYDPDEQRAAANSLFDRLVPVLDEQPEDDERKRALSEGLGAALPEFASCCKDAAFAAEREWRVVYNRGIDDDPLPLRHRTARGLLVPYVELALPGFDGELEDHLPLLEVNCGPGPEPALKGLGVRSLLAAHPQFAAVSVGDSSAPLRL